MLIYIIDAFNSIYKLPEIKNSFNPYQDFINYIKRNNLTGSRNNRVIIVFDGYKKDIVCDENFKVIFSQEKTADFVIQGLIKKIKNKSITYIISDDNEIINYARKERANFLSTKDFFKIRKPKKNIKSDKDISYSLQKEITDELKKIWKLED